MSTYMTGMNPYGLGTGYSLSDQFFNTGTYNMGMGTSFYNPYMTNMYGCNSQAMWDNSLTYLQGQNTYNQSASSIYNSNYSEQLINGNQSTVIRNMIATGNPEDAIAEIDELTYTIMQQPQYQGISAEGARALALQQAGGLQSLISASENCDSAFKTGFLSTFDFLKFSGDHEMSQEEFVARLQGSEVPNEVGPQKAIGAVAGGAGILGCVAAGAAIGTVVPIGGNIVGGIVGGIVGVAGWLIGAASA